MTSRTIQHVDELNDLAHDLLTDLASVDRSGATVLALAGDLGAGKTALTQAIGRELQIDIPITSPTFVIARFYNPHPDVTHPWKQLVHIDAYRLESADEAIKLGWNDWIADPGNLICLEWPEHIQAALPANTTKVSIAITGDESREVRWGS